ncbi:MAG: TlpA family protein disulfide reductase [Methylibium sp.]|uniref:TlpA family protein disulfide reductase n=1 Tax=Methylibium sp. TaxID=2067992 RepID=UPI00184DA039|nr:TlpA disulfide reductase family protein [Methylibium sp.]MBA3595999.1 TlpA family protein disulfide reductase [Methylibium sp.]
MKKICGAWSIRGVTALLACAAVLGFDGIAAPLVGAARAASAEVDPRPLFAASFKDFDRKQQSLAQFKGKPMVVYFWATWCKSCKQEVPELIALHKKFGDKMSVIGIAIDNTDKVIAFAQQYQINYPLLLGSNDAIALSKQLGNSVGGLPFAVVVDAHGKIVKTLLGETPPGKFEELIRPLVS